MTRASQEASDVRKKRCHRRQLGAAFVTAEVLSGAGGQNSAYTLRVGV